MAIATIRRMLIELGLELPPGEVENRMGLLSQWISQPRPDLAGQTPLQVLSTPDGEMRLRQVFTALLSGGGAGRSADGHSKR